MSAESARHRVGFGAALTNALQWRLLLLFTIGIYLPTAVASVPAWRLLAQVLDHSPRARAPAARFDVLVFEDVIAAFERSRSPVGGAALVALFFAWLLWPLFAGITLAAVRAHHAGFVALLQGALAWYGRMFRMALVSLVPLAAVGVVGTVVFKAAGRYAGRAVLESQASWAWWGAWIVTLLFFVLVHATVETGRAQLGVDGELRSAWRAWVRGIRLTFRRPFAVLGCYLGATLSSLLVAAALLVARLRVTGASAGGFLLAFALTQLAVAAIGWGRASRLFALVELCGAREIVSTDEICDHRVRERLPAVRPDQDVGRP